MVTSRRSGDGRRPGLTPELIVRAAVDLARRYGIAAVSMRRIAGELGTAPMSLYRHVADRDELLRGMLDVVAEGIRPPPPAPEPRAELLAVMTAARQALIADVWVVEVLATYNYDPDNYSLRMAYGADPGTYPNIARMVRAMAPGRWATPTSRISAGYSTALCPDSQRLDRRASN